MASPDFQNFRVSQKRNEKVCRLKRQRTQVPEWLKPALWESTDLTTIGTKAWFLVKQNFKFLFIKIEIGRLFVAAYQTSPDLILPFLNVVYPYISK
jgi:hypothetical protein